MFDHLVPMVFEDAAFPEVNGVPRAIRFMVGETMVIGDHSPGNRPGNQDRTAPSRRVR